MLSQNMGHQSPSDMVPYPRTMEVLVSTSLKEKRSKENLCLILLIYLVFKVEYIKFISWH